MPTRKRSMPTNPAAATNKGQRIRSVFHPVRPNNLRLKYNSTDFLSKRPFSTFQGESSIGSFVVGPLLESVPLGELITPFLGLWDADIFEKDNNQYDVALRWVIEKNILRVGLSGPGLLDHSEYSMPGDELTIKASSDIRLQTSCLAQQLSHVQAAGNLSVLWDGKEGCITSVKGLDFDAHCYVDANTTQADLQRSLGRFVKAWHHLHGNADMLEPAVLKLGGHVNSLIKRQDPSFKLAKPVLSKLCRPVMAQGYMQEKAAAESRRIESLDSSEELDFNFGMTAF